MTEVVFHQKALDEFYEFSRSDKKLFKKIYTLIQDTIRNPFSGLGKPEPLKHQLTGYWSKRIDKEHRLVYKFENDQLLIISCKYHY